MAQLSKLEKGTPMPTRKRRVVRVRRRSARPIASPASRIPLTLTPVPRPVRRSRIAWGSQSWGTIGQPAVRVLAQQAVHDLYIRVWLFALADANQLGHAEFPPGALRAALAYVKTDTGEVILPNAATVSKAIGKAKAQGMLTPESHAGCLVLPQRLFKKGAKGTNFCKVHGINVKSTNPRP